jgi:hypothetical protein
MHGGCQFGIFANWLFLKRLAVPIRESPISRVSKRELLKK